MKKLTIIVTIILSLITISFATTSITQSSFMPSTITYSDEDSSNSTYTYILYNSSLDAISSGNYTYGINLSENLSEGDYTIEIVKTKSYSFTVNNPSNDPEQLSSNEAQYFSDGNVTLNTTYTNFYENTIVEHSLLNVDTDVSYVENDHLSFDYNGSYYNEVVVPNASLYYYTKVVYYENGSQIGSWSNPVYVYQ